MSSNTGLSCTGSSIDNLQCVVCPTTTNAQSIFTTACLGLFAASCITYSVLFFSGRGVASRLKARKLFANAKLMLTQGYDNKGFLWLMFRIYQGLLSLEVVFFHKEFGSGSMKVIGEILYFGRIIPEGIAATVGILVLLVSTCCCGSSQNEFARRIAVAGTRCWLLPVFTLLYSSTGLPSKASRLVKQR